MQRLLYANSSHSSHESHLSRPGGKDRTIQPRWRRKSHNELGTKPCGSRDRIAPHGRLPIPRRPDHPRSRWLVAELRAIARDRLDFDRDWDSAPTLDETIA